MKNIGIFAHVDAGKTTTTEMILYHKGLVDHVGSVNNGTTRTDSLAIEKKRGISIKAAFISMEHDQEKINLIDTPGHVQFFSEVLNTLQVIDGAILIFSAIEGIQSQTLMLYEYLNANQIPIFLFINKIDREGFDFTKLKQEIAMRFQKPIFLLNDKSNDFIDFLSENSTDFFKEYCEEQINSDNLFIYAKELFEKGSILLGTQGSSKEDLGIEQLINHAFYMLPSAPKVEGELSAYVFNHGMINGEKVMFLKVMQGQLELKKVYSCDFTKLKINRLMAGSNGKYLEVNKVKQGDIAMIPFSSQLPIGSFLGLKSKIKTMSLPIPMFRSIVNFANNEHSKLPIILTKLKGDYQELNVQNINGKITMDFFDELHQTIIKEMLYENYGLNILVEEIQPINKVKFKNSSELIISAAESPEYSGLGLRITPRDTQKIHFHSSIMKGDLKEGYIQADFEILEPFIHLELSCEEASYTEVLSEIYLNHLQVEIEVTSIIQILLPVSILEKLEKRLFRISEGKLKIIHHEYVYKPMKMGGNYDQ